MGVEPLEVRLLRRRQRFAEELELESLAEEAMQRLGGRRLVRFMSFYETYISLTLKPQSVEHIELVLVPRISERFDGTWDKWLDGAEVTWYFRARGLPVAFMVYLPYEKIEGCRVRQVATGKTKTVQKKVEVPEIITVLECEGEEAKEV